MKKLFLISISFLPALIFAASFSPYLGDEDWGGQGAGSDFLQNFIDPDTGEEDESILNYMDRQVGTLPADDYACPYCMQLSGEDPQDVGPDPESGYFFKLTNTNQARIDGMD